MKVFQLVKNPYIIPNPYVATLMDGIKSISDEVEFGYGIEEFWNGDMFSFDVLHIHWPDAPLSRFSTQDDLHKYESRLKAYKSCGGMIVVTCHNLTPHYCKNSLLIEAYNIVYGIADVIIHLGNYSRDIMVQKYPAAKHVICYHHTYDNLYNKKIGREECLKVLHLDPERKYILSFGDFRDDEERELIDMVLKHCYKKGIDVLAPRYYKLSKRRNLIALVFNWFLVKYKVATTPGLHIRGWYIPNEELPYYYGVSAFSLIQRKKILNSGNLPMGFLFGNIVVGPNVGNVGEILKETGNPTFIPEDEKSILAAVDEAIKLSTSNKGEFNKHYAETHFSTQAVCQRLLKIYKDSLQH